MSNAGDPVYVTISALEAGQITLPEPFFVAPAESEKRTTVPSLSFLIQHPGQNSNDVTRIVFDLGVKRDLTGYTPVQQEHIANRQPVIVDPDCAASLRQGKIKAKGGGGEAKEQPLEPDKDIDVVILSHVHWDHVGTSSDFSNSIFAVGSGTLDVLKNGAGPLYPPEMFNDDELPVSRTVEFPPVSTRGDNDNDYDTGPSAPKHTPASVDTLARLPVSSEEWSWQPLAGFPHALDLFGDGSLHVIDTPGHIYGHVNLFARIAEKKYVYLGGDCCHDRRILSGEKGIAMYDDGRGGLRSVHMHTEMAKKTLARIGEFLKEKRDREVEVEVVLAHDVYWREQNRHRFWPGRL